MSAIEFNKKFKETCDKYGRLRNFSRNFIRILNTLDGVDDCCRLNMNAIPAADCSSPSDNLTDAKDQVDALWDSICVFNTNIGIALGGVYDRLGEQYGSQFQKVDPVGCVKPQNSLSLTWSVLISDLDDAIKYTIAKCGELNQRASNFHDIFGDKCLISAAAHNADIRLAAIIVGAIGAGMLILPIILQFVYWLYILFRDGYGLDTTFREFIINAYESYGGFIYITFVCLFILFILLWVWVYYKNAKKIGVCNLTMTSSRPSKVVVHHRTDISNKYTIFKNWTKDTIHKMNPSESDAEWAFSPGSDIDGFSDGFTYNNEPTKGSVIYGENPDLVKVNDQNQLVISVSKDVNNGKRRTVRMHANELYDSGVFIMDVAKVPADPTTWPSFWLRGDTTVSTDAKWSCYGEVDIIEGANGHLKDNNRNQCTLHTNKKLDGSICFQYTAHDGKGDPLPQIDCGQTNDPLSNSCGCDKKSQCPNLGCAYKMGEDSFGTTLNQKGGGIFASEVSVDGKVSFWFWPRNDPLYPQSQIESGTIDTTTWNTTDPANTIHLDACPGFFKNLAVLINTTLCGEWAGSQYKSSDTPPIITGWDACNGAVADIAFPYNDGSWVINAVKIFQ